MKDRFDIKVLVACEFSGVVRNAFAEAGFDAWSCDLLPSLDGSNKHIQGDVRDHLDDGWDMLMVAHPPCTRLCNSSVRWLHVPPPGKTLEQMWAELDQGAELFSAMRQDATFINTGRGATVVEDDMISVFRERQDLTALLDVTAPEPPKPDSPFYEMSNIHLTTHIAGSLGDEVVRMADYSIEEFQAWEQGRPLRYAVTREMLSTMA